MTLDATPITLSDFSQKWLPQIETAMRSVLEGEAPSMRGLYSMMRYHLGWENQEGQPESAPQGKRVRPLVVLLCCQAAGADPATALPAAAAVELLHNFSLIHDDIEDRSATRRHRPTLWSWAGVAQAINTGDAMFAIARLALAGLEEKGVSTPQILESYRIFDETSLRLTEGQYLDIAFETRTQVSIDTYQTMISGKTAALLAAAAQLGAVVANSPAAEQYRQFGFELGLSFQIQDDILGIWGDKALTGKSAASDILTRKKTLPVLYALAQTGAAATELKAYYSREEALTPDDLPAVLSCLERLHARKYAEARARAHAEAALAALRAAHGKPDATRILEELALRLVGRQA